MNNKSDSKKKPFEFIKISELPQKPRNYGSLTNILSSII